MRFSRLHDAVPGERGTPPENWRQDAPVAVAGACFALIQAAGGLTPAVITAAAMSLAAAGAFAAVEPRSGHPMLPLELFRSRQFAAATVLALVAYAALGGVIFLFVAFLQITLGYTALQAGAATLPVTALSSGTRRGCVVQPARWSIGPHRTGSMEHRAG